MSLSEPNGEDVPQPVQVNRRAHAKTHTRMHIPGLTAGLMWNPLALACPLEVREESCMNMLRSSGSDPTLSVQLPPKVKRSHSDPKKNQFCMNILSAPGSFPHDFVYTRW